MRRVRAGYDSLLDFVELDRRSLFKNQLGEPQGAGGEGGPDADPSQVTGDSERAADPQLSEQWSQYTPC